MSILIIVSRKVTGLVIPTLFAEVSWLLLPFGGWSETFFRVSIYTFQGRSFAGGQWIEQENLYVYVFFFYKLKNRIKNATDCGTATLIDDILLVFFFWDAVLGLQGIVKFLFNENIVGQFWNVCFNT